MRSLNVRLAALTLALGACGSAQPAAVDVADDAAGSSTIAPSATPTTTVPAASDEELTRLLFGFGFDGDPEEEQEFYRQQEADTQESIRSCMAGEGFEYIPVSYPQPSFDFEFDEREMAETQGFGVSTWYFQEDEFLRGEEEFVDPNQEMIEAMSDGERDAYYQALYGDPEEYEPTYDAEGNEVYEDYVPSGCEPVAYESAYGGQDLYRAGS